MIFDILETGNMCFVHKALQANVCINKMEIYKNEYPKKMRDKKPEACANGLKFGTKQTILFMMYMINLLASSSASEV